MRINHSPEEKARIVLEAIRGESTVNEIASEHNVHPNMLTRWKTQAVKSLPQIFENETKAKKQVKENEKEKEELYRQIGKLTTQIEWLKKNLLSNTCRSERLAMAEPNLQGIPVSVQADLLGINRTSLYYKPCRPSQDDIDTKGVIDRIYTAHPEFGYRRITVWLRKYEGLTINHKTVLRHMQEMGIQAVYPRQNTSKPNLANKVYPYLLTGLAI